MLKPLRIDYHHSYWPYKAISFLFLVANVALLSLRLPIEYKLFAALLLLFILYWQWISIKTIPSSVQFDGKQWILLTNNLPVFVRLLHTSFISRYFVVLVFLDNNTGHKFSLFFARDNCNEADYRSLCRLALNV